MSPNSASRNISASPFTPAARKTSKSWRASTGASKIENIDEPGGGKRVRLTDPDGFQVEVVHGMAMLPKIPVDAADGQFRRGQDAARATRSTTGASQRGPSHVKRIGHFVVHSPQFEKTLGWYREMLGFRCSDEVYVDSKDNIIGSFNRLDRGDDFVDHHVFFCIRSDKAGLNHLSATRRPTSTTS